MNKQIFNKYPQFNEFLDSDQVLRKGQESVYKFLTKYIEIAKYTDLQAIFEMKLITIKMNQSGTEPIPITSNSTTETISYTNTLGNNNYSNLKIPAKTKGS